MDPSAAPPDPLAPLSAPHCKTHHARLASGSCARCGDYACTDCLGEEGLCQTCQPFMRLPWEERARIGFVPGFFRTVLLAMSEPRQFCRAAGRSERRFDGFLFGSLCALASVAMGSLLVTALGVMVMRLNTASPPGVARLPDAMVPTIGLAYLVVGMLAYGLGSLLWAGVLRLSCGLFGLSLSFGRIWRISMYASAPFLVSWVPVVGLGATLYSVVLTGLSFSELSKASLSRSMAAVLVPCFVLAALVVGGYLALFMFMMAHTARTVSA